MATFSEKSNEIFWKATQDYRRYDDVDAPLRNSYPEPSIENDLYRKNWIDAVQWHLEDIVRDPAIFPYKQKKQKNKNYQSNSLSL